MGNEAKPKTQPALKRGARPSFFLSFTFFFYIIVATSNMMSDRVQASA